MRNTSFRIVGFATCIVLVGAVASANALECPVVKDLGPAATESARLAREYTAEGLYNRVPEIIDNLRRKNPNAKAPELINALIAAYCPKINDAAGLSEADRQAKMNAFAELVRKVLY